ncbi:AMP-binding protein [Tahibacter sp. UC22_41]|uniref:AMP-binding protein n=1 Tax=Tahibacter sp. UC22_41 TaxID=3350178 RepID=UPI0036DA149F
MKKPIWEPSPERIERANLNRFARFAREQSGNEDLRGYAALYEFSIRHPERFWPLVWEFCGIRASGTFHETLVAAEHPADTRWFPGIRLNVAQNLLRFRDERCALTGRDPAGAAYEISHAQLQQQVARVAAALRERGIGPGDCVAGLLRNGSEAVVAMLASIAVGALWTAPPPAQAANVLNRLQPRLVFADTQYLAATGAVPEAAVVVIGARGTPHVHWNDLLAADAPPLSFELAGFEQPLYALAREDGEVSLHSAGGTLIQHLKDLVLQADLKREDRVLHAAAPHTPYWHWLTSALAVGAPLVLADEEFSLAEPAAWDLVDAHAVSVLATDTAQLAAFAASPLQPRETHKLLALKTVLAIGAAPSPDAIEAVYARIKDRLMLSLCAGDAGGLSFVALGSPLLPVYTDELQCRGLGMRAEILADDGRAMNEQCGVLACLAPFPALPLGFVGDADGSRFRARYFAAAAAAWCAGEQAMLTAHEGLQFAPTA